MVTERAPAVKAGARFFWATWFLAALVGACGSPTTPDPEGSEDLGVSISVDVGPAVATGCRGYIQCLLDCGDDQVCSDRCDSNVTPSGTSAFRGAIRCGQNWCLGAGDLGVGVCKTVQTADGGRLVNLDGTTAIPGTACGDCLDGVFARLLGQPCPSPEDLSCNPAECAASIDACIASTP